ncbi:MAG: peptidoglycan DD-metalloendopeptidase family protein [Bacilli bacterium]
MKNKLSTISLVLIVILLVSSIFILGFNRKDSNVPKTVYHVYLDGESIGYISNRKELEDYINKEQSELKKKYEVDKVHLPEGLEIQKEITYSGKIMSAKEVYEKIKDLKPFTISGYIYIIKGQDEKRINVLNKEIFEAAAKLTIHAFVDEDKYTAFLNETQKEIIDFGRKIEDIYIEEEIIIKRDNISTNELIFTNSEELSKYLLFGTLEKQKEYTVKLMDTIEKIAFENELNIAEFLIANPQFSDVNNLLYEGQKVSIGLINPQFSVILEEHVVEKTLKPYKTEIRYDNKMLVGNEYQLRAGVNGEEKVTQKVKIRNGEIESVIVVATEELKPTINRIYVKGGRAIPSIGDNRFWAWPTTSRIITSTFYDYRYTGGNGRKVHAAIDIAGPYNSPIYAANNGTIHETGYTSINGNYIIINHNNGYYSYYGHLAKINVRVGQAVERSQKIGQMGNTGYSTGTHVHFSVWLGEPFRGTPINPLGLY